MSSSTTHYGLVKPSYDESADVSIINANMDLVDTLVYNLATDIAALKQSVSLIQVKRIDFSVSIEANSRVEVVKTPTAITGAKPVGAVSAATFHPASVFVTGFGMNNGVAFVELKNYGSSIEESGFIDVLYVLA